MAIYLKLIWDVILDILYMVHNKREVYRKLELEHRLFNLFGGEGHIEDAEYLGIQDTHYALSMGTPYDVTFVGKWFFLFSAESWKTYMSEKYGVAIDDLFFREKSDILFITWKKSES